MRCPYPITIKNPAKRPDSFYVAVPCGRCGACRYNRRVDWSFRLKEEFKRSLNGRFITLTYNDENVPIGDDCLSLHKRDLQLFLKRFRKANSEKVRFYAVGEYGPETLRPHYHALLFNVDLSLMDRLDDVWHLGHVYVGHVSDASIHYVTKFHVNVSSEPPEGKEPEFVTMSRKPGIGKGYIDRVGDYHNKTKRNYVRNEGYLQRMPRYYKDKIFSEAEKRSMRWIAEGQIRKLYDKEYNRLVELGFANPAEHMGDSDREQSRKVIDKFKEGKKI